MRILRQSIIGLLSQDIVNVAGGCEDVVSFVINSRMRNCDWVGQKAQRRDKHGQEHCPATRGLCPRTPSPCEDTLSEFQVNGNGRTCEWVVARRDVRCDKLGEQFCAASCEFCELELPPILPRASHP